MPNRAHCSVVNSAKADINESVIRIQNQENDDEFIGLSKEDIFESVLLYANATNIQVEELHDGLIASINETFIIKSFENLTNTELEEKVTFLRNDFGKY